ncbi:signal transduction histidine kinase [Sulfuritortus calidifontis]|uniref:histidine kinase n=1 Tax=Sulfuritortus calidifontis TaxID=1914471 RepID=A0A4R3K0Y7_9PROT|nr:ATP-binding protein [Sulfuritortus calidifontis]TCS74092.1 signal transduction histidine kinase [Sulfuritortus calidifontis]
MKVRTQVLLLGFLPMIAVALLLGGYLIQARLQDLEQSIHQRGQYFSEHLAQHVQVLAQHGPLSSPALAQLLRRVVAEEGVLYARVWSDQGHLIGEVSAPDGLAREIGPLWQGGKKRAVFVSLVPESRFGMAGAPAIARVELALSYADYWQTVRGMLWVALLILGLGLLLAGLLAHHLTRAGLKPLMEAIATVRRIAGGDLQARVALSETNEIGQLQQGINQMGESLESLRDNMRQRVAEATAELARQKETAELANRAKSKFLAAASHDLRQPMHAIGLFAAALQPHVTTTEGKAILDKIQASLAATESLFSTVLDVSKLDAGIITPQVGRVSVAHLLDRLRDDFQYEAASKGLRLKLRSLPLQVMSDPVLLDRILRNLVTNALRYTDRGGILIAARRRGEMIRFQVWDSGIGIAPEHFADIFAEFYQVQTLKRDRAKGLGLGLAIVDRLVRLLDHDLEVRSTPGKGTVFSVDVPLAGIEAGAHAIAGQAAVAAYTRLHGRVLVVDDDENVLDALAALLRGWGLEVVMARNGDEAVALAPRPPSLLLTDYHLGPGETGLDVVERLRHRLRGSEFPVVVVTGDTTEAGMQAIADKGYPLLHKPVQPAKLRALVTRLLRREAASA